MDSEITGVQPIPPAIVVPGTTTSNAPIVPTARLDAATLEELLTHETVLKTGVVKADAQLDTLVLAQRVGPRFLVGTGLKSRIAHLAELFQQWQGELRFRIYFTKSVFQQLKIVLAFVPTSDSNEPKYSALQLRGFHNSVVLNPSNDSEVVIPVPFISGLNWLPTTSATGWLVAKVFQPMVVTQATNTDIPWTLCVSANTNTFTFRYILPAPAISVANDPSSLPNQNAALDDTPSRGVVQSYARACSAVIQPERSRVLIQTPLACPLTATDRELRTCVMFPLSKIDNVFNALGGKIDFGWSPKENWTALLALQGPAVSFSGTSHTQLPRRELYYPNLVPTFPVAHYWNKDPDWSSGNSIKVKTVYTSANNIVSRYGQTVWIRVPEGLPVPRAYGRTPKISWSIPIANVPFTIPLVEVFTLMLDFVAIEEHGDYVYHRYEGSKNLEAPFKGGSYGMTSLPNWSGLFVWPDEVYNDMGTAVVKIKDESKRVPAKFSHFCVYLSCNVDDARKIASMLMSGSYTGVSATTVISLSLMQGSSMTDDGRLMIPDQKTSEWSMYRLNLEGKDVADFYKTSSFLLDYACPYEVVPNSGLAFFSVMSDMDMSLNYVRNLEEVELEAPLTYGVQPYLDADQETCFSGVSNTSEGKKKRRKRRRHLKEKARSLFTTLKNQYTGSFVDLTNISTDG